MKRITQASIVGRGALLRATPAERECTLDRIRRALVRAGLPLEGWISQSKLYFRPSIIASCNLSCFFCHNEGGLDRGRLDYGTFLEACEAARLVGFVRVQLTGGEPLLHPRVADFVSGARAMFSDVGVTTNGTYLAAHLDKLIDSGLTRLHLSLQRETLASGDWWHLPGWLHDVARTCDRKKIQIRFNLPVARVDMDHARDFLKNRNVPLSVNVFSVLDDGEAAALQDYSRCLSELVNSANEPSRFMDAAPVMRREYVEPAGIRCAGCGERPICREASRSLRLGTDASLRPCLATRYWDFAFDRQRPLDSLVEATLLALDFTVIGG